MKKQILLVGICCLLVIFSSAQIDKGDLLLGGTFGYGTYNSNGVNNNSNTNLNPRIGYGIGRNSVLSVRLGYYHGKSEDANGNNISKNTNFSTGLSWQNFFPIKDRLGWYSDIYGMFGSGITRYENNLGAINKNKSSGYSAGASPGIYFIPVSGLLISANAGGLNYGYSRYQSSGQPTGKNSNFNVNLLNYFGFGIDFIINKKKG